MKNTMKKVLCTALVILMCLTNAPLQGFVGWEWPDFGEWFSTKTSAVNYEDYFNSGLVDPDTQVVLQFDLNGGTIQGVCRVYDEENQQFVIVDGEEVPDPYMMLPIDSTVQIEGLYVRLPHINAKGGYRFDGWFCYRDGFTYPAGEEYQIPYGTAGTVIHFMASFVLEDLNYVDPKDKHTEGKYTYTLTDDKATIIDVDDSISGDIVIPSTLGGYPVVAIGDEAFVAPFITSVSIPEGVTSIGNSAFAMCVKLKSITLPETLTEIDDAAFANCFSLEEIILPEDIEILNDQIFYGCFSLERLVIKNSEIDMNKDEAPCYVDYKLKDITLTALIEKICEAEELYLAGDTVGYAKLMDELNDKHVVSLETSEPLPLVTIYSHDPSTAKTYAEENGIPFKNISELEELHTCSFGDWFTETAPTVFSEGVSKRVCDCGEFETKPIAKLESASAKDETTKVEITYTEENFESEVEIVVSEEEINANIVFGNEFESYKAYDISLEADGEKVQPKGYVTVKLPIPADFNAETTVVYYVDDSGNKTKIESTTENGYIVFETDHFSEYVLVDESSKIEPPHEHSYTASITKEATCTENGTTTYTCSCGDSYNETIEATGHDFDGSKCKNCDYDKADTCDCNCHKGGFMGFIWKIINFFQKLFKSNQICKCGIKHY